MRIQSFDRRFRAFDLGAANIRRTVQNLSLNEASFRTARAFLPMTTSPASSQQFVSNTPTLLIFNAGETPRVDAFSVGGKIDTLLCTLMGREIAIP